MMESNMDNNLVRIGEITNTQPSVFELIIEEHVRFVNPEQYGLQDVKSINPADYFITSGDAVEKARILSIDMLGLANKLRNQLYQLIESEYNCSLSEAQDLFRDGTVPTRPERFHEYESDVWEAVEQTKALLEALKKAKGNNCFLETEWDNHKLLCIPKNPRMKG